MHKISWVAVLGFAVLAGAAISPAWAQGSATGFYAVFDNCQNRKLDPDTRIKECTAIIHSNMLPHSDLAVIYVERAGAFVQKGDVPDALQDFAKSIELKPDLAAAYGNRGVMLANAGRTAEAQVDLERAAFLHLQQYECAKAVQYYDDVLQIDPKSAAALYGRGLCEKKSGDDNAAQADRNAALALDPTIAQKYDWPQ